MIPGILSLVGITEIESIKKGWDSISSRYEIAQLREDYIPGDLGLDPLNIVDQEYKFKDMRSKELNNGRLAMIASIIIIIQQLI